MLVMAKAQESARARESAGVLAQVWARASGLAFDSVSDRVLVAKVSALDSAPEFASGHNPKSSRLPT